MKNPFFKEEKEWRICYWTDINPKSKTSNTHIENNIKISDIEYHDRRDNLIPHKTGNKRGYHWSKMQSTKK